MSSDRVVFASLVEADRNVDSGERIYRIDAGDDENEGTCYVGGKTPQAAAHRFVSAVYGIKAVTQDERLAAMREALNGSSDETDDNDDESDD